MTNTMDAKVLLRKLTEAHIWRDVSNEVTVTKTGGTSTSTAEIVSAYANNDWLVLDIYFWPNGQATGGQNFWQGTINYPWRSFVSSVREASYLGGYVFTGHISLPNTCVVRAKETMSTTTSAVGVTFRIPIMYKGE